MKNFLIINAHPDENSFCKALAERYLDGAKQAGAKAELIHLNKVKFNPILQHGYRKRTELEPELLAIQHKIKEADHIVFVYPTWWSTYPALLKGFIDRVFLPGFAFNYRENSPLWDKHLKGKSARIITTMDAPKWYYRIVNGSAGNKSLKVGILNFCGIKPVRVTSYPTVKTSTPEKRERWLEKTAQIGFKDAS